MPAASPVVWSTVSIQSGSNSLVRLGATAGWTASATTLYGLFYLP